MGLLVATDYASYNPRTLSQQDLTHSNHVPAALDTRLKSSPPRPDTFHGKGPFRSVSGSSSRVALHHLRRLDLAGRLPHLFSFLDRFEHPDSMEDLSANVHDCATPDISQTIGPYLRDHVQRRGESQNGLSLFLTYDTAIRVHLNDGDETYSSIRIPAFAKIMVGRAWYS